ncbi:MAG: YcaO-like family protein [Desulfobacterales bacterium]|nr:YcaO-like family protein [Desulfobacterales bacterium]
MTYGIHKDKKPTDTINWVRKIAADLDILLSETKWENFAELTWSVGLRDMAVGQVIVNGKGITKEYALASAYAEFMERLQNGCLYRWKFGAKNDNTFKYPDQQLLSVRECLDKGSDMGFTQDFLEQIADKENKIPCLPFYDFFEKKKAWFPVSVLYKGFSNTGMCAGNTPPEAMAQGICEIFERYVSQLMFSQDDLVFPNIPLSTIQNSYTLRIINSLRMSGYNIILKDLTMDGRFPVVAAVLLNPARTKMRVSAGSFVTIELALERCLTEMCQGLNAGNLEQAMTPVVFSENEYKPVQYSSEYHQKLYEQERWRINKSGRYPNRIMFGADTDMSIFQKAFLPEYHNSTESFSFLADLLKKQNYKLFVRDVSFLGFPAYYVYIPGLSERIGWQDRTIDAINYNQIPNIMLRLNRAEDSELMELADYFEIRSKNPHAQHTNFPDIVNIHVDPSPIFSFPRVIIWAMIHYRRKEYKKAFDCISSAVDNTDYASIYQSAITGMNLSIRQGIPTPAQMYWLALFFKLKSENFPENEITSTLQNIFGQQLTTSMYGIVNDNTKIFGSIRFPDCTECSACPVRIECNYEKWNQVISNLNRNMNSSFPNQEQLDNFTPTQ